MNDRARLRVLIGPWARPDCPERTAAPFRASWPGALNGLEDELALCGWDGAEVIRSGADHPGITVHVDGLVLACDRYGDGPQCLGIAANLRAITRTIRALRTIERDGVSVSVQGVDQLSPRALLAP
jgi:hypothetical protein